MIPNKSNTTKDLYIQQQQQVINLLLDEMKNGNNPWRQPWVNQSYNNPVTGTVYSGMNKFLLGINMKENNWTDPRYLTFVQCKQNGYKVKKGSKATTIFFMSTVFQKTEPGIKEKKFYNRDEVTTLSKEEQNKFHSSFILKEYKVFNANQIEGIPALVKTEPNFNDIEKNILTIAAENNIPILFENQDRAYYKHSTDTITMPPRESFISSEAFCSTLLHEMVHATLHESRLNREKITEIQEDYKKRAKEELIAEISSVFSASKHNITIDYQQNAAYIKEWHKIIEHDNTILTKAIQQAHIATEYLHTTDIQEKLQYREQQSSINKELKNTHDQTM